MRLLLIIVIILYSNFIYNQCTDKGIVLNSQNDVNNFRQLSEDCDSLRFLAIQHGFITNLDSLSELKYVGELRMHFLTNLQSYQGLKSLKAVDYLWIKIYNQLDTFPNLDTVVRLDIDFPTSNDSINLSSFNKVEYIQRLTLKGNANWKGLGDFRTDDEFRVSVVESTKNNDISLLIPQNKSIINSIYIWKSKNINIDLKNKISQIDRFILSESENINLTNFSSLKKLSDLLLIDVNKINFGSSFYKIEELSELSVVNNNYEIDFYDIIPNLNHVNGVINISNNKIPISLNLLRNFKIPSMLLLPAYNKYIYIENNTNITGCKSKLLCEALRTYPDSVILANNSSGCNLEDLIEYCITSTDELVEESTTIYPNPTSGMIYLMGSRIEMVEVIDQTGRLVFNGASTTIDLTNQPNGLYLLRIHKKDGTIQTEKVIKI